MLGRIKLLAKAPSLLCALGTLSAAAAGTAHAAEITAIQASRDGNQFQIGLQVLMKAPAPAIFRALHDYGAMPQYNPDLRAVRIQTTSDPNRVQLWTTIHTCVLFFCKTIRQQQLMTSQPTPDGGVLLADFLRASGAFEGHGRWVVTACGANQISTCMEMHLELAPQFWVPPVIGPWLIRRKMAEEARSLSAGLEQVARGNCRRIACG